MFLYLFIENSPSALSPTPFIPLLFARGQANCLVKYPTLNLSVSSWYSLPCASVSCISFKLEARIKRFLVKHFDASIQDGAVCFILYSIWNAMGNLSTWLLESSF